MFCSFSPPSVVSIVNVFAQLRCCWPLNRLRIQSAPCSMKTLDTQNSIHVLLTHVLEVHKQWVPPAVVQRISSERRGRFSHGRRRNIDLVLLVAHSGFFRCDVRHMTMCSMSFIIDHSCSYLVSARWMSWPSWTTSRILLKFVVSSPASPMSRRGGTVGGFPGTKLRFNVTGRGWASASQSLSTIFASSAAVPYLHNCLDKCCMHNCLYLVPICTEM